jgi:hypothetical protein
MNGASGTEHPEPLAIGDRITLAPRSDQSTYVAAEVTFLGDDAIALNLSEPAPWLQLLVPCVARRFGPDGIDLFATRAVRPVVTVHGRSRTNVERPEVLRRVQRRSDPRLTLAVPMAWASLGSDLHVDHQIDGWTLDMSVGGLRFHTAEQPGQGDLLVCAVYLPDGAAIIAGAVLDVAPARPAAVPGTTVVDGDPATGWIVRLQFAHVDNVNLLRVARTVHGGLGLDIPRDLVVERGRHNPRWDVYQPRESARF